MSQSKYISSLVQDIDSSTKLLDDTSSTDHNEVRAQALESARKLVAALATPTETVLHHSYEIPPLNMCVRTAVAMRVFHILVQSQDAEGVTADELSEKSKGEKRLIVRMMRILTAAGYAAETAAERYAPTPITAAMTTLPVEASIKHRYDFGLPTLAAGPDYYASTSFHSPTSHTSTPFQRAFSTDLGFYDYLSRQPDASRNFQTYMSALQKRNSAWVDWYPVNERIINGFLRSGTADEKVMGSDVLLVDVGGGEGHYVKLFRGKFPDAAGRVVLQDLHQPTADLGGVEYQKYSFFDEQPVKGARTYYTHFVLTDWADDSALSILQRIAEAMKPGYSKLIINDVILPDTGCQWQHAALDIIMMSTFAGFHRGEGDLRKLVEAVGLEVEGVWYPEGGKGGEGVLEAVKR